jgi:hypothetical protein
VHAPPTLLGRLGLRLRRLRLRLRHRLLLDSRLGELRAELCRTLVRVGRRRSGSGLRAPSQ